MKNGEYETVEQIEADLNLMFENAKRYNMPNSSIYKRAFRLQQIMQVVTSELSFVKLCFKMFSLHIQATKRQHLKYSCMKAQNIL